MAGSLVDSRLLRREILRILDAAYLYGASIELIMLSLADAGYPVTETDVEEHLVYLRDKGYATIEQAQSKSLGRQKWAKLTPKGKDLLDGNIDPDPGVMPALR